MCLQRLQLPLYGPRPWLSATVITLRAMPMVIRHNYKFIRHNYYSTGHAHGYPPQLYHHANGQTCHALGPRTGQCHRYRFTVLPSCSHNTHLIFVLIGGAVLVPADFGPKKIGVLPQLLGFKHILNVSVLFQSWRPPSNRFWLQLTSRTSTEWLKPTWLARKMCSKAVAIISPAANGHSFGLAIPHKIRARHLILRPPAMVLRPPGMVLPVHLG